MINGVIIILFNALVQARNCLSRRGASVVEFSVGEDSRSAYRYFIVVVFILLASINGVIVNIFFAPIGFDQRALSGLRAEMEFLAEDFTPARGIGCYSVDLGYGRQIN